MEESLAFAHDFDEEETDVPNEEPNGKIIKISAFPNMDPVEHLSRFFDILEMIFQYLNGRELIRMSEICPSWYNFIASSNVLMNKIKIVNDGTRKLYYEDYNVLNNSSRRYQNIELSYAKYWRRCSKKFRFFLRNTHDWKNVKVINSRFANKHDSWNILSSIQSTVESLSIINIDFYGIPISLDRSTKYKTLKFPKLKYLKIYISDKSCLEEGYAVSLLNSVAIEKFDYEYCCNIDRAGRFYSGTKYKNIVNLTKMLRNFDKLTNLSLKLHDMNELFKDQSWKDFPFKLKNLAVVSITGWDQLLRINFRDFLESQCHHIEELKSTLR